MSLILDEHRQYLADDRRLDAFARAIARQVRPGDVVLDLAAGTGILGMLACRAGAARVYAVETGGIVSVARAFAQANGIADRMVFIRGLSTRITLPERVDVVVSDLTGHLGIEAGAFEYFDDARRRLMKPGGGTIPCGLEFHVAALESDDLRSRLDFWSSIAPAQFDVSSARSIAINTGYPAFVAPEQLLSAPRTFGRVALPAPSLGPVAGTTEVTITRAGRLDGIAAWCTVELAPGVSMSNSPVDPERIARRQVMLPFDGPTQVAPGDRLAVSIHMLPTQLIVTWRVSLARRSGETRSFSHSTFNGMLVTGEDRITTDPEWRPSLTPAGLARQTVLELCDGRHALREIERGVFQRHQDLLQSEEAAAAFVAEVLSPYGLIERAGLPDR